LTGIPTHAVSGGNDGKRSGNNGKQQSATVLARAKGKRVPRRASRVPWPALRAMADVKESGRGASQTRSRRRLPAASTTGQTTL
jgi:hypothetical protein